MRKIITPSIASALLFVCADIVWPGEDKDARAIIAKALDAAGGEAKLAKLNAVTWTEKGTYYGTGDGLPYTGKYALQWPGQFRMEIEGIFTIVIDGDKGWIKSEGAVKELTKEELALQIHNHKAGHVSSLRPLKDKAFHLKTLGDAMVVKQPARVVQVTHKGYPDVKLYFDKKTGLLVKSEYKTKAPEQKFVEVNQEAYYSDYRDVAGAKMPHKLVVRRDGKLFVEAELSEVRAADQLEAKVFAKPAD